MNLERLLRDPAPPDRTGSPSPKSDHATTEDDDSWLCCARCESRIVPSSAIFQASGAPLVFANPEGVVFEIVTSSRAEGLAFVGPAVSEFSWFAGYAWRVALCAKCWTHLGWRYEACGQGLTPQFFFGLQRRALVEQR